MAPAFPDRGRPASKHPREPNHPVAITCLQWDSDGALEEQDRMGILSNLAATDPFGVILIPWQRRRAADGMAEPARLAINQRR
jgi:hypothetical protein